MRLTDPITFALTLFVGGFAPLSTGLAETKILQVDILASQEIHKFVTAIASPTAKAPMGSILGTTLPAEVSKYVTIGKKEGEEAVVTSIGVIARGGDLPSLPPDTVAVLRVQVKDECQVPHGNEYLPLQHGISPFIVSYDGANIWEIGAVRGVVSIRLVRSETEFGVWESY
ncbi:MAG: hypothetical protein ACJ8EL_02150, partial [Rhizomicrobium sp.]